MEPTLYKDEIGSYVTCRIIEVDGKPRKAFCEHRTLKAALAHLGIKYVQPAHQKEDGYEPMPVYKGA